MDPIVYTIFQADHKEITWWAMCIRASLTFFVAIILIKVGGKRMFGKQGAFDIVVSIMLGTLLARGITGNSQFIPTMLAALTLALIHRIIAYMTFVNKKLGKLVKGTADLIVKDGVMQYDMMKKHSITERDILEAVRSEGKLTDIEHVKEAYLERSGKISVIPKK